MPEAVCPLCHSSALAYRFTGWIWWYTCPTRGTFEFGDFGSTSSGNQERWHETRFQLSKAARKASPLTNLFPLKKEAAKFTCVQRVQAGNRLSQQDAIISQLCEVSYN